MFDETSGIRECRATLSTLLYSVETVLVEEDGSRCCCTDRSGNFPHDASRGCRNHGVNLNFRTLKFKL